MRLVNLVPVRNEEHILGFSLRAMLMWCDAVVVLNHASTDRSGEIIREVRSEFPGRVAILEEPSPVWEEMRHRQRMLDTAREYFAASHIATVDADEVLTHNLIAFMSGEIVRVHSGAILQLPWLAMWGSPYNMCSDGVWGKNFASAAFKDNPSLHWAAREGYDFHHRHPVGYGSWFKPFTKSAGGLMHFQFTNLRRLRAKQALYKMTEVLRWPDREPVAKVDARYNPAVYGAGKLEQIPASWLDDYPAALRAHCDFSSDVAPWQEVECKRLWSELGRERFSGLDLFGVVE